METAKSAALLEKFTSVAQFRLFFFAVVDKVSNIFFLAVSGPRGQEQELFLLSKCSKTCPEKTRALCEVTVDRRSFEISSEGRRNAVFKSETRFRYSEFNMSLRIYFTSKGNMIID